MANTKLQCRYCTRHDFKNPAGKSAHERTAHHEEYYRDATAKMRGNGSASPSILPTEPAAAPPDDLAAVRQKWQARIEAIHQELVYMEELKAEQKELERLIAGVDALLKQTRPKPIGAATAQSAQ